MNVDIFLDENEATQARVERVLSAYPELFHVRWHAADASARFVQLYLASLPLDATTGHTRSGELSAAEAAYGGYGYYAGEPTPVRRPALALFDRLALLSAGGGLPHPIRPGVWEVSFQVDDLLRAAFHQALEAAFAELRESYAQLRATQPGILELPAAARLLQVTPTALRRALRR